MEYRIEVTKKVVGDSYIDRKFIWHVIDEKNKSIASGEADSWNEGLESGRNKLKRLV